MSRNTYKQIGWMGALGACLALVGCGGGTAVSSAPPPATSTVTREPFRPDAPAGIPIAQYAETDLATVASNRNFGGTRQDPFSLKPTEQRYEAEQRVMRFLQDAGGFSIMFEPPEEKPDDTLVPIEQQPYRRLSGILVGDSVHAIIELEGGRTEIVRPGTKIPNTEWTVVSIDGEKAILRRPGNRRPNEIVVRLESPPAGQGGGRAPTGGGAGRQGGGAVGAPGGGAIGAPGGGAVGAPGGGRRGGTPPPP
ncbi:MAG: hypothetical protein M9921_06405 [Fimbriimonadaceae bacterium]|nr:hypothetical protein [Chthonomonadaceae bacterium]MCO5296473.1 hypothetical protein [Fimbriimonadaceae bacterium]